MDNDLLTVEEIRTELRARGLTVSDWARAQGFPRSEVYAVLNGRIRGNWGKAHEIAIALGLKAKPNMSPRFQCLDNPQANKPTHDSAPQNGEALDNFSQRREEQEVN